MWFLILLVGGGGLAACNHAQKERQKSSPPTESQTETQPTVELALPDSATADVATPLEVTVTQGGKPVGDADDVQFEVWKKGADQKGA